MGNFKVGDKVLRVSDVHKRTEDATGIKKGYVYTVEAAGSGLLVLVESLEPEFVFSEANFTLVQEQDDPLPPAPESVYYPDMFEVITGWSNPRGTGGLEVKVSNIAGAIAIRISDSGYIRLDADAALQLAHDLTRMAMERKRKKKWG